MVKDEILQAFDLLNDELEVLGVVGEICIVGGAALCIAFDARISTRDVDGIFKPSTEVRVAAKNVAQKLGLDDDWLNDGVKGFLQSTPSEVTLIWGKNNLKIWLPPPDYLLAMKVLASRAETSDYDDIVFLAKHLGLKTAAEIWEIALKFYGTRLPQKASYVLQDLEEKGSFADS